MKQSPGALGAQELHDSMIDVARATSISSRLSSLGSKFTTPLANTTGTWPQEFVPSKRTTWTPAVGVTLPTTTWSISMATYGKAAGSCDRVAPAAVAKSQESPAKDGGTRSTFRSVSSAITRTWHQAIFKSKRCKGCGVSIYSTPRLKLPRSFLTASSRQRRALEGTSAQSCLNCRLSAPLPPRQPRSIYPTGQQSPKV